MGFAEKSPQHVPYTEGLGYPYIMIALNKAELTESLGVSPDPTLLAENTAAKSKLGKSWEPNSKMINEETKTISFSEKIDKITKDIGLLFTSNDNELIRKGNELTEELNTLNKKVLTYEENKTQAENNYHQLKSKLSSNPQESLTPTEEQERKQEFNELPKELKDLEKEFLYLEKLVETARRPIAGPRPE